METLSGSFGFLEHSFDCWSSDIDDLNFNMDHNRVEETSTSNGENNNSNINTFCDENNDSSENVPEQISSTPNQTKCSAYIPDVDVLNTSFSSCDSIELSLPSNLLNLEKNAPRGMEH